MSHWTTDASGALTEPENAGHSSMVDAIGVFARLSGGRSGDRPGLAWRTSPFPIAPINRVMARGLNDADVDAGIQALADHADIRPTMLYLGPFRPERLVEVIARVCTKGLVHYENERLMSIAVADLPSVQSDSITVTAVESRTDAEAWSEVCAVAFNVSVEHFALWTDAMADPASVLWQYAVHLLVRADGQPAATAVVIRGADLGGIYAVGTAPAMRRRGAAAAATLAAGRLAGSWGCTHITLQSTAVGLPLYERLGFRSHGDYAIFMTS